jgi:hypothetical protein
MKQLVTPSQVMQPRIVSLTDLKETLLPLCLGYAWAEGAITDLWLKGAPVPQPEGAPERRILIPQHFATWWGEIQQRMGVEATTTDVYRLASRNQKTFRSHAGLQR